MDLAIPFGFEPASRDGDFGLAGARAGGWAGSEFELAEEAIGHGALVAGAGGGAGGESLLAGLGRVAQLRMQARKRFAEDELAGRVAMARSRYSRARPLRPARCSSMASR